MLQNIISSHNLSLDIATLIAKCEHDKIFILVDENTKRECLPLIKDYHCLKKAETITIKASDINKNINTVIDVWTSLQTLGATRHSVLINLGGGMVTDLGGFAASTFKRGIKFINIPTTLLAMVDASVGGKTGINFRGLKNEIGVFNNPISVVLNTQWLKTLDRENILSGFAEMLKHSLISDETMWAEHVNFDLFKPNLKKLSSMLTQNIKVKEDIVLQDPTEKNIRKALNFGHTFGHAFESWAIKRKPILHGYAVAYGLIPELFISMYKKGFPTDKLRQTVLFIQQNYGTLNITCDDYTEIINYMHHDKKNSGNDINITLLNNIGNICINQTITEKEIKEALDFFREG